MRLTRLQRRTLEVYRWYHQNPTAMRSYVIAMLWRSSYMLYGGILAVAVLVVLISRVPALAGAAYLLLGVIVGVALRAMLGHRQTARLWPLLDRIIDWEQVERLLQPQPAEQPELSDPR